MDTLQQIISKANIGTYRRVAGESIISWAERNINLSSAHGESGPLRLSRSKYLIEPLLALSDRQVSQVVCQAAVQTGKTLIAEVFLLWSLINRPGSIQWFAQTDTKSEEVMLSRIKPMMLACKDLMPLLPNDDRKIRGDGFRIPGCEFVITGHSDNDIQSSTRHLVIVDELAHYDEGTTLEQIKSRTAYTSEKGNSKTLIISQAGRVGNEMSEAYKEGTMEEWNVPCFACGKHFKPMISHFTAGGLPFDDESLKLKDNKGKYIIGKLEKVLTLDCPYCGHGHRDTPQLKSYWNDNGQYIQTNPDARTGYRSFHWSQIHCNKWIDIVSKWIIVCKLRKSGDGREEFERFLNQELAVSMDPDEYLNSDKVVRTDKPYDKSKWEDEYTRNFILDVQKDRFFGNIRAYSKDGRSRQLWCGWLYTIDQVLELQQKFNIPFAVDRTGKKTYSVLWDSGYALRQTEIYTYCVKYNHLAIKGDTSGTKQFDNWVWINGKKVNKFREWAISTVRGDPYAGQKLQGKGPSCPIIMLATDTLKKILVKLIDGKGPEWLCLSKEDNQVWEDYNKGLFNEEFQTHDRYGKQMKNGLWKKINEKVTNEAFDVEAYSLGAAIMAGVEFDIYNNLPDSSYLVNKTAV